MHSFNNTYVVRLRGHEAYFREAKAKAREAEDEAEARHEAKAEAEKFGLEATLASRT